MPHIKLLPDAVNLLSNYFWPGNIRQLKNITEQISAIEHEREISASVLVNYLPQDSIAKPGLPVIAGDSEAQRGDFSNEREILYKVLFDLKRDVVELKKLFLEMLQSSGNIESADFARSPATEIQRIISDIGPVKTFDQTSIEVHDAKPFVQSSPVKELIEIEDSLSLQDKEKEMIVKALKKHKGKRKTAARELGISERTLYRKINEYNIVE
jgi:transcriptional regulator with PAS, ATPase and Fis domain